MNPVESPQEQRMVEIDFSACEPVRRRIDVALGSTTYEITGREGDLWQAALRLVYRAVLPHIAATPALLSQRSSDSRADFCWMRYGGEIENPLWDGRLDHFCRVPSRLGKRRFTVTGMGVDFSPLDEYCRRSSRDTPRQTVPRCIFQSRYLRKFSEPADFRAVLLAGK